MNGHGETPALIMHEGDTPVADEDVYVFPASFGQRRLWFLDRFEPGSPYYNIPLAFRLKGDFDVPAFRRVVQTIVDRHETLRTTIREYQGEPVQVIAPRATASCIEEDVRSFAAGEREAETLRIALAEARSPFDLARGPLCRTTVIHAGDRDTVVLMTLHHCIADGWSMAVLMQEVVALYAAYSQGRPSPLTPLSLQYADYSEWQRTWFQGEARDEQIAYWTGVLQGAAGVLELPTDRPRPAVYSNIGASTSCILPAAMSAGIQALCRQEGVTPFMVLFSVFAVLLHRYTGQKDLCVGTPIANRTRAETEALIGLFINTIVLRTQFDDDPSFVALLHRVRETTLGAYAHQDLPLEMLLDALHLDRDMTHPPLFQVMFILQNVPSRVQQFPDVTLEQLDVDMGTSTYELTLLASESESGIMLTFEYNTDLFDESTIRRMGIHYEHLLSSVLSGPLTRVSALRYLGDEELAWVTVRWNPPEAVSGVRCVYELIQDRAARAPDAVALIDGERRCSYGQMNARANWLARRLRDAGIGPETRVGIALPKSIDLFVAVLGVMKSGAAYVPLDPSYPRERLDHMVRDAAIEILITRDEIVPSLPPISCRVFRVEDVPAMPDGSGADGLPGTKCPDLTAYVIYTSGTTGVPKGTMISHRSLYHAYRGWEQRYDLCTTARVHLQMASFSFDVFTGDLVRALCSGGTLVLCPRECLLDAEQLYHLMVREGVTIAEFVPAVLRNLLVWCESERRSLDFLRLLIAGSDVWYVREYDHLRRMLPGTSRLINSYGVTEATIDTTLFERETLTGFPPERLVPIGRPFPGQAVYILDGAMAPVGIGIPGELYIGGPGLARGYAGQPATTATRFVPDPVSGRSGARLYRTGDVGRFLADGTIEFMGRADLQVKVRGFRIEPGDIEAALVRHAAVREAVVTAREEASGSRSLVAYVLPHEGEEVDGSTLRAFLADHLPEYMVPSAFVIRTSFPLTPNGKVDRKALPAPRESDRIRSAGYVAPSTPQEETIAGIWSELLGVGRIGVYDDFFQLGGHSLLATQLVSRLRTAFGCDCPLRTVFETPTVAGLATALASMGRRAGGAGSVMGRIPRPARIPLSFAQQRMWFLQHLEPDSPFYVIPEAYRISGVIDPPVLHRALQMLVRRHEILRTAIREEDGVPWQEVLPVLEVDMPVIDMTMDPTEDQERAVARTIDALAREPFILGSPPLFRITLITLSASHHVLVAVFHHCISDNWSSGIFLGDLSVCYERARRGAGDPPPLPLHYADHALWQRATMQGDLLAAEIGYWREKLAGVPQALDLPTDHPRPAMQTFNGAVAGFTLPHPAGRRLRELAQDENATMFMLLLAAFDVLLYRYSGQETIAVGTPVANRGTADLEQIIGLFVNTLVLRADLGGRTTFRALLRQVRTNALEAYAHQDVPFEKLVDALQPDRDLARSPLFQAMFVLQNARAQRPPAGAIGIEPMEAHSGTSKFDLTLFMVEQGDDCGGVFEFNADLFERETIERMVQHFTHLLEAIGTEPDLPVGDLAILGALEQRTLVHQGRGERRAMPEHPYVHEFIEARAALAPDLIAVESTGGTLTYRELCLRAHTLAHCLQANGIGPEDRVGVLVPRSHAMIVAVLGILGAGGAYVPIEHSLPDERIAFLVEDAGLAAVVTTQACAPRMRSMGVRLLILDGADERTYPEKPSHVALFPDSLAYVIYTSGSTGSPKGTLLTHRGLMNYVQWCLDTYPCEARRTLLHLPLAFDASITAVFPPLIAGGTIVLADDSGEREMPFDAIVRSGQTFGFLKLTPAHLEILTHTLPAGRRSGFAEAFVVGGEQFTGDQAAPWRSEAGTPVLYNEYGPTEAVVGCVVARVDPHPDTHDPLPIGRPIPNTAAYVLDEHLHPVPQGVWGELCIAGVGLARGYLNRGDLTAASFIPDPFSRSGDRMYRSGDVVRWLPDGALEFRGRRDAQLKFHGYRIEPGEIEAAMRTHPAVREAVVCITTAPGGESRLVGYFTTHTGKAADTGELRDVLRTSLPSYMVPAALIHLEGIPLTAHGKVDRARLPRPDAMPVGQHHAVTAPRSITESTLARIWTEVLGVGEVGIDDNFFALGGDSILAIQVLARAAQAGITLSAARIFQHPTIREQAVIATESTQVPPEDGLLEGEVPLTPVQHWFFDLGLAIPSHWNQSVMIPLATRLDLEECREAVRAMMEHHDALRMRFSRDESGWHQWMAGAIDDIPVAEEDLTGIDGDGLPVDALESCSTRWQASLDIVHGPVIRVVLYHMRDGDRLLVVIHHLVVDAVSWTILFEDLRTLYSCLQEHRPLRLPPRTASYRQWATHLRRFTEELMPREEVAYWREVGRYHPVELFPAAVQPAIDGSDTVEMASSFSPQNTQCVLQEATVTLHADVTQILIGVLTRILSRMAGVTSVWLDVESHGRQEFEAGLSVDRTVGWFTVIYPLLITGNADGSCADAVRQARADMERVPGHGRGFGLLRTWSPSEETRAALRALPRPQVVFNYLGQSAGSDAPDPGGLDRRMKGVERAPVNARTHVLEVSARVAGGQMHMMWSGSRAAVGPAGLHTLVDAFAGSMAELIAEVRAQHFDTETAAREFGWKAEDLDAIAARALRSHGNGEEDSD